MEFGRTTSGHEVKKFKKVISSPNIFLCFESVVRCESFIVSFVIQDNGRKVLKYVVLNIITLYVFI